MTDYTGEYGCSVASSRPEDLVPGLINLLRTLDKEELLSSGQQDELAWLDTAWENGCHDVGTLWTDMDTEALIDLAETALPAGFVLDISGQWADRCVYVDYDPSYRVALVVPDDMKDEAWDAVEDATGEAELDSAGRITVPYEFLQEATDRLGLCGIKYVEVWD